MDKPLARRDSNPMVSQEIEAILAQHLPTIPAEDRPITSFFDMKGASLAILAEQFTQAELVEYLIRDIRHLDPRIRQKAIDQYLRYMKDILTVNGRIGRAVVSQQEHQDGQTTRSHRVEAHLLGINPQAGAHVPGAQIHHPRTIESAGPLHGVQPDLPEDSSGRELPDSEP